MDESREPEPPAGSRRAVAGVGKLTPLQQAYSRYVTHQLGCGTCQDVDAGRCATAEGFRVAWKLLGDDACEQMRRGA
ncbi:hypothetical protein [Streptomyces sp. NPDC058202]|uniref:hypothetical protein n=1 Tax=Streptomyces sp. NPDC058202 TaxID=3346380 RepID=UPI0036E79147